MFKITGVIQGFLSSVTYRQQSHDSPFQQWVFHTISNRSCLSKYSVPEWCAILSPRQQASNTKSLERLAYHQLKTWQYHQEGKWSSNSRRRKMMLHRRQTITNLVPNLASHYWQLRAKQNPTPISKISPKCEHHCQITVYFWGLATLSMNQNNIIFTMNTLQRFRKPFI